MVDANALPQTIAVVETRAHAMGIPVVVADLAGGLPADVADPCGVLVQYPGADGAVLDPRPLVEAVHAAGGMAVVAADLLALTLLESPGAMGADVVVGSSQRFGVPLFYGGPHAGFMSVRAGLERHLPGRLVGVSVDAEGRPAYRLALQTREQHIRRDKATSNICTAQVLLAVVASMYAVYHGPDGLRTIARRTHRYAAVLAAALRGGRRRRRARAVLRHRDGAGARASGGRRRGRPRARRAPAARRRRHRRHLHLRDHRPRAPRRGARGVRGRRRRRRRRRRAHRRRAAGRAAARDRFLTHEVFNTHRSETSMLRYLRRLSARDYALDRGMIPLGSCTMKLNATTEMEPVSLPGFADLHPFAPAADAAGYPHLIEELESWLAEVTGYDRVSIQPNAGSQGELAGLLAIRAYHRANGDTGARRLPDPGSAHGTNAASAVMAGMRVVVVKAATDGRVDMDDLRAQCEQHADDLAAIMVDLPLDPRRLRGRHRRPLRDRARARRPGVRRRREPQRAARLRRPGEFGGDVSHLNLHKTFCIPHGGGGPGVGPVGVRAHLAPYLPSHPGHPDPARRAGIGPSARRRTARRGSCRSPGRTCG